MNISELSIRRPVLATVLTIIILLFGFIGYSYLGVREYPSVDNPIISVSCSYPGANADVIENQITEPLEQNINGIPGIRSLSSVSQQGQSRITVEFELSVDLETAANDVRDKVSRAQRYLPRDCDPPTVSKADADAMPILMVALQSDKRSLLELSEIADLTVKEQLQTISDVSSVSIWGEKRYSMRLWLDPVKMAGYGITPIDVKNAVDNENVELPSGSIEGNTTELTIRTLGLMHTADEFNNLIVKEDNNRIVRFSDIGRAELGPADIKSYMKMNGVPMVGVVVIPQPGANHIEIADAVYKRMEQMKKDLPEDVTYSYGFDNTKFIRASINEVKETVYVAFILVIIIIFLFLRDWRVTLVPCIVIPVSLIGAFFVMYLAGFSINVLSMLAIVLAVGLVVDDAIVYPLSEGRYFVVLNVGKGERIAESLSAWAASEGKSVTIRDLAGTYGKLDLQGPATVRGMTKLLKDPEAVFDKLPYFSFKGDIELANSDIFLADGTPIFLSRTGYTGEQGFEIFVPYDKIVDIWNRILEAGKDEGVIPCGLAARDSVRAGAVLPLSQQDIGPWAFVNNPWPFTLPKDENGNWTKNFFGRSALEEALASGNVTYTYAYCGFDPRKVTSPDHDTHPQVLLNGEVIGDVLTCVADVSIGRVDGVITSVASPEKPEGFAPKGLVCGFVRVNRPLENGTKLTLADPRRKIQVETVTDIRPARTARKKLGSL